jgi:uncharacterized Zn finger protein
MRSKTLKRVLKKDRKSASYYCEATGMVKADQLPKEDAFRMKRKLGKKDQSASYCCEAAGALSAEQLPSEDAY